MLTIHADTDPTDPDGIRRLRLVLKRLLRAHRLKCLAIVPVHEPDDIDVQIDRAMLADGENMTL
jgi:hypothetical protein